MSSHIKQTLVMVRANLLSLPRRLAISLSMVLSVALVVCVLAGFLSMAKGFEMALRSAGSPSVAVILGGGTSQEMGSEIPASVIRSLGATSGDIGTVRNALGALVSSRELVVPVEMKAGSGGNSGADRTVALRGMDTAGPAIREGIALSQGRHFSPGTHEMVVGDRLASEWGLSVGDKVRLGTVEWTVAGQFSAHGSAFESEIWASLDAVQSAFDRQGQVQSLRLRLEQSVFPSAFARHALHDHRDALVGHIRGRSVCLTVWPCGQFDQAFWLAYCIAHGHWCDGWRSEHHDELAI